MLHGALAAAVTPLRDGGTALDEAAVGPYVEFLAAGGVDGVLVLGTTGEGILLDRRERSRVAELYVDAARGRLSVAVHCGAQTTADTVALADHAAVAGTASALLGLIQFMVGALAAPLVGVAGPDTAVPMAVIMVTLAISGLTAQRFAGRRRPWRVAR